MIKTFPDEKQAFAFAESKGLTIANPRLIMEHGLAIKKYAWGLIRDVHNQEWDVEINDIFLKVEIPIIKERKDTPQDKEYLQNYKQKQIEKNLVNPQIKIIKPLLSPFNKIVICRVNAYKEIFISGYIKQNYSELYELLENILLDYIKEFDKSLIIRLIPSENNILNKLPIKLQNKYSSAISFIEDSLKDLWLKNFIFTEEV